MKYSRLLISEKTKARIREIYHKSEADRMIRILTAKRLRLVTIILIIALVASVPVFVFDAGKNMTPVKKIPRNEYGMGDRTVTLVARTQDGMEEKLSVNVTERRYTDKELEEFSKRLDEILWTDILGENHDPENIVYDLNLPEKVEGYPFRITWRSDRPLYVSSKGAVDRKRLEEDDTAKEGIQVCLKATLRYKDYEEDKYSYVVLKRQDDNSEKSIRDMIEDSVRTEDEASLESYEQDLPETAGGKRILFYKTEINRGFIILIIGIVISIFVTAKNDDEIRKEADRRRKQIDSDHAGILNRYALYHSAGMNPRAIWTLICNGYEKSLKESGKNRRYAYDEMLITKKMIDEGAGEIAAYDDFAARLGSIRYRSFISLVKQSVINGSKGLSQMLSEEVDKAQRDHLNEVKAEAAEAQTKLLLPMFMMLMVVIAIVCIPAFTNLSA